MNTLARPAKAGIAIQPDLLEQIDAESSHILLSRIGTGLFFLCAALLLLASNPLGFAAVVVRERGPRLKERDPRTLVEEYDRNVRASIRDSRTRFDQDRMVLYTGIHDLFKQIDSPGDCRVPFGTGDQLLTQMGDFPGDGIPNLVILLEGTGGEGGKSLSLVENAENDFPATGLYMNEAVRLAELRRTVNELRNRAARGAGDVGTKSFEEYKEISDANSANLVEDVEYTDSRKGKTATTRSLATRIRKGEIKFRKHALIQLYASNLHTDFATRIARITGCQVVFCTGKVTGKVTGRSANSTAEVTLFSQNGDFVKLTPLRNAAGEVYGIHEDRLGKSYKILK